MLEINTPDKNLLQLFDSMNLKNKKLIQEEKHRFIWIKEKAMWTNIVVC